MVNDRWAMAALWNVWLDVDQRSAVEYIDSADNEAIVRLLKRPGTDTLFNLIANNEKFKQSLAHI